MKECKKCKLDRILSAHNAELDRIAEGIKICYTPMSDEEVSDDVEGCGMNYESGADDQLKADRAYIQAQKR